jgi:hypothetical protein
MQYAVDKPKRIPGLYPTIIDNRNGEWQQGRFLKRKHGIMDKLGSYTVGASADSFYEYLLKIWIASDRSLDKFREYYDESAEAIKKVLIRRTANGDLFLGQGTKDHVPEEMEHLVLVFYCQVFA